MKKNGISAVFHYLCLHESPYYSPQYHGKELPVAKKFDECLVRLPLYYDMTDEEVQEVINCIKSFFNGL